MAIEPLVVQLSHDPFNPQFNFEVALEYESLNQSASAVSFFLRTAEYGDEVDDADIIYIALIKVAKCMGDQHDRLHSVSNALLQAITVRPDRPEAYFLLSQFHERAGSWQECYTWASIGKYMADKAGVYKPSIFVGYYDSYCLEFEMAVSSWWIGRQAESRELFTKLSTMDLAPEYTSSVSSNLARIQADL